MSKGVVAKESTQIEWRYSAVNMTPSATRVRKESRSHNQWAVKETKTGASDQDAVWRVSHTVTHNKNRALG